jgi:hypothetical protein
MPSPGEGSNVFALIPLADMKHFGRELRFWSEAGSTSLFHTSSMPNAIFVRIQLEASGGGRIAEGVVSEHSLRHRSGVKVQALERCRHAIFAHATEY